MTRISSNRVCFCIRGHAVSYSGFMQPAGCKECGAMIDMSRPSMTEEEAEKRGLLNKNATQKSEEPKPVIVPEPEPAPAPAPIPAPMPAPTPFTSISPSVSPVSPPPPTFGAFGAPAQPIPAPARPAAPSAPSTFGAFGTVTPAKPFAPAPAPATPWSPNTPATPFTGRSEPSAPSYPRPYAGNSLALNFFGTKESIPQEGGWIGRGGIGSTWLEGCLLISRKHVHIRPNSSESVLLGPDHSLNGVSYDAGQGKTALRPNETVEVPVGSTIWLYNIPLKLESE